METRSVETFFFWVSEFLEEFGLNWFSEGSELAVLVISANWVVLILQCFGGYGVLIRGLFDSGV